MPNCVLRSSEEPSAARRPSAMMAMRSHSTSACVYRRTIISRTLEWLMAAIFRMNVQRRGHLSWRCSRTAMSACDCDTSSTRCLIALLRRSPSLGAQQRAQRREAAVRHDRHAVAPYSRLWYNSIRHLCNRYTYVIGWYRKCCRLVQEMLSFVWDLARRIGTAGDHVLRLQCLLKETAHDRQAD